MKQTAMQELKSDLVLTKETTKNSFSEIKNQEIKDACIKVVEMTLNSIITRIDTELLEMEKEQIMNAREDGHLSTYAEYGSTPKCYLDGGHEQYYNETFKSE